MPRVKISGAEYPIEKTFSDDFNFSIPRYQRPYSWTREHAGELFDDLITFMGDSSEPVTDLDPYFLGSVVLIKEENMPDAEIVDGQQRITTLTILLAAIRQLTEAEFANDLTTFLYEKGNSVRGTPDRPRLTLRSRDADFFKKYIQGNEQDFYKLLALDEAHLTDTRINIRRNAELFVNRLKALPENDRQRLAQFIINRCFLVVVSTPDLDSAYRIFSVLNDRGMDLSHTDILKAEIIGSIHKETEQELYTEEWEDIEEMLGRDQFADLFAHIRMIYRKTKPRESVLKEVREHVKPAKTPKKFVDNVLSPYANAFNTIKYADYESTQNPEKLNRMLTWLNRIDNVDWLPPSILYLSKNRADLPKLTKFFTDLERLAAGLMIMRAGINQRLERYGALLSAIEAGNDLYDFSSPLQLTINERKDIKQGLEGPLYLLRNVPRYVLLRLDEALSDGSASYHFPVISIEHVLPQNPPTKSQWIKWFPNPEDRASYVHRLGNLVLLSRRKNSRAQNYDFDIKKDRYFTGSDGASPFTLTTQVLRENKWTSTVVDKRQQALLKKLCKLWRL